MDQITNYVNSVHLRHKAVSLISNLIKQTAELKANKVDYYSQTIYNSELIVKVILCIF